jgi:two-component system, NarL family, response regulator LiaR
MNRPEMIRVLLVDDHSVVRSGLAAVLMSVDDMELVGEAGDGEEAIARCEQLKPDVVLMDIMMPVMDGLKAARAITERWPQTRIIMLTSFKAKELLEGAVQAGAAGYLLKNVSADELLSAIRETFNGKARSFFGNNQ